MGILQSLQRNLAAGMTSGKRLGFSGYGGGIGGLDPFGWWQRILPGAQADYRKLAGILWENSVILIGVKWYSDAWSEGPLIVTRPTKTKSGVLKAEPVDNHPILDLIDRPDANPLNDADSRWCGTLLSWIVDGNAYWYVERAQGGRPIGLRYLPHYYIYPTWPQDGTQFISHYEVRVNGEVIKLPVEDVIHMRDGVDPLNSRKGLSRLGALLREVCTVNEAATYSAAILRNMGIPGVIVAPKAAAGIGAGQMGPDQAEKFKALWKDRFGGDNSGMPLFQSLPIDITVPGFSPEQLVLDKVRDVPTTVICAGIGADPMVFGLDSDSKTYSNLPAATRRAYQRMVQIQRRVNGQLMTQLSTQVPGCMPGDKLTRDWSQVAALQEDQDLMVKRLVLAAGGAIETVNEARESLRLPRMTDPEYDEIRSGGGQSLEESQAAEAETARLQGQGADNGRAYRRFLAERWSEPRAIPSRNGHNLIPS